MVTGYLDKLQLSPPFASWLMQNVAGGANAVRGDFNFRNAAPGTVQTKPGGQAVISTLQNNKRILTDEINALQSLKTSAQGDQKTLQDQYDRWVVTGNILKSRDSFFDAYNSIVYSGKVPYLDESALKSNNVVKLNYIGIGSTDSPSPGVAKLLFDYKKVRAGSDVSWRNEVLNGFSTDSQGCDSSNRAYNDIKTCTPILTYQMGIVFIYLDDIKNQIRLIGDYIKNIDGTITTKFIAIGEIDKQITKLLGEEQTASDQRIKENLTNPEYVKAKMAYDLAIQDSARKSKRNLYLFIGGVLVVGTIAAIIFIPSKKNA